MSIRRIIAAQSLLLILALPAHAADRMVDIKGITLGMSRERVSSTLAASEITCNKVSTGHADIGCTHRTTLAGADALFVVMYSKGAVASVHAQLKPSDWQSVFPALEKKFGKPTRADRRTLRNAFGAEFVSNDAVWIIGESSIIARQYFKFDQAVVWLVSSEELRQAEEDERAAQDDL
ncbi:MAG: hypothetical protein R3F15_10060 [Lysobacterales bacterium]